MESSKITTAETEIKTELDKLLSLTLEISNTFDYRKFFANKRNLLIEHGNKSRNEIDICLLSQIRSPKIANEYMLTSVEIVIDTYNTLFGQTIKNQYNELVDILTHIQILTNNKPYIMTNRMNYFIRKTKETLITGINNFQEKYYHQEGMSICTNWDYINDLNIRGLKKNEIISIQNKYSKILDQLEKDIENFNQKNIDRIMEGKRMLLSY